MMFQVGLADLESLITEILVSVILLIYCYFFVKKEIEKKTWMNPNAHFSIIILSWFFVENTLKLLFLIFFGEFLLFDIIIVGISTLIIAIITAVIYGIDYKESLKFISLFQMLWYGLAFIFSRFPEIINIYLIDDRLYGGSQITFIFSSIIYVGIIIFVINWGDKIQYIKNKGIISALSILPGLCFLTYKLIEQKRYFYENLFFNLSITFIIGIIIGLVLKEINFKTIKLEKLRELNILEKGKPLLSVNNLKVHYPLLGGILKRQIGAVNAVDGVSFEIKTGETFGLVGESGCGKTSIANAILGLVDKTDGNIIFQDDPIPKEYTSLLRQKIQFVFQDPDSSLNPRLKVVDIIAEPFKNLMGIMDKQEIREMVLKLLKRVSLKREHMDRYPHEFSGGQKQRIIIARALACNPELIILDEPTSALDVSVQAQILNLLKDLQREFNYGYLFITHNLAVVNHIADRVGVMYLGRIVEEGSTEQIFFNPTHPYTKALLESRSEIDPFDQEIKFVIKGEVPSPINPPSGCHFNPRCFSSERSEECTKLDPPKIEIEDGHYVWCLKAREISKKIQNK
ncbi:MAG: ABC transporter ATP-binding protein [Promethearchaeota archaeon]